MSGPPPSSAFAPYHDRVAGAVIDLVEAGVYGACFAHAVLVAEILRKEGAAAQVVGGLALHASGEAQAHYWVELGGETCDPGSVVTRALLKIPAGKCPTVNQPGFQCPKTHRRIDLGSASETEAIKRMMRAYCAYKKQGPAPWLAELAAAASPEAKLLHQVYRRHLGL